MELDVLHTAASESAPDRSDLGFDAPSRATGDAARTGPTALVRWTAVPRLVLAYRHLIRLAMSFGAWIAGEWALLVGLSAHLLLQVRTRTLNDDLGATFCQWYPAVLLSEQPADLLAS